MATNRRPIIIAGIVVLVIALVIAIAVGVSVSRSNNSERQVADALTRAKSILQSFPVVDGHNDFPWMMRVNYDGVLDDIKMDIERDDQKLVPYDIPRHTDIPKLKAGQVGGQFWAAFAYCNSEYKDAVKKALQQIDLIRRYTARYPDVFELVTDADGIAGANSRGHIASILAVEGGHLIDNSFDVLRAFYDLGSRYLTLTWSCDIDWADSYVATRKNYTGHGGLTQWGERLIEEMNRLGMIVDISHVAWSTMEDALRVSSAPVIFSHSNAFALCPHHRNVPDDILQKLKSNGGVIMVNFYTVYINCTTETRYNNKPRTASIAQVVDHLNHIKNLIGIDHIGIGADYDGVDEIVTGLDDASMYPNLFAALLDDGWSEDDLKKLAIQNIVRVWKEVEKVRDNMTNQKPDDTPFPEDQSRRNNSCSSTFTL